MDTASNDNIFGKLRGLVWGIFIGVVSFQILAPNIWDYLHSSLGMGYSSAYWLFTVVYFLCLPLVFLLWIWWNLNPIKTFLPPFNNTAKLNTASKIFIWGLRIFILLQCTLTIIFFFTHVSDSGFTWAMSFYGLCNFILLVFCFKFCLDCIDDYFKKITGNEKFFSSFNNFFKYIRRTINEEKHAVHSENENQIKEKKLYKSFMLFAGSAILILALLFTIGFFYLNKWEASKNESLSSKKAGDRGFALLYLNETIDSIQKYVFDIQDSIKAAKAADDLNTISIRDTSASPKHDTTKIVEHLVLTSYGIRLSNLRTDLFNELNEVKNIRNDSTETDSVEIRIIALDDSLKRSVLMLPGNMNAKDLAYLEMLRGVFNELSKKVKEVAQTQLGLQLRSVQAKGMMLLLSLFFTILALYIFLKTNQDIQNAKLQEVKQDKRLDKTMEEQAVINLEEKVAKSGSLSGTLWMFLTITAWLLIPIFKMVKDEDIDVKSPYKSVTFASPANDITPNALTGTKPKGGAGIDSSYLRILRIDSVFVIDSAGKHDIDEIKRELKSIHEKVNPIVND